ncbi:MAG: PEGA domain-containing protein [Deltaproteobacteria bacterium]|nr:PEGA domain-containing protein [Deltaproteobacteria bacterium]
MSSDKPEGEPEGLKWLPAASLTELKAKARASSAAKAAPEAPALDSESSSSSPADEAVSRSEGAKSTPAALLGLAPQAPRAPLQRGASTSEKSAQPRVSSSGVQPRAGSISGVQPRAGSIGGVQPRAGSIGGVQPRAGSVGGVPPRAASVGGAQPRANSGVKPAPRPGSLPGARPAILGPAQVPAAEATPEGTSPAVEAATPADGVTTDEASPDEASPEATLDGAPTNAPPVVKLPLILAGGARAVSTDADAGSSLRDLFTLKRVGVLAAAALVAGGVYFWTTREPAPPVDDAPHVPSMRVTTVPDGAFVYVDGQAFGPSPATVSELEPGKKYMVRVSKTGFKTLRQEFMMRDGGSLSLTMDPE